MKYPYLTLLVTIILFSSCKKEEEVGNAPELTYKSVDKNDIKDFENLEITITYSDNDGDLGENDANIKNCFVTDSRNNVTYEYRISQLAPDNASISITGDLNITIENVSLTDGATSETITYDIYVVDRAGNQSNTVTTEAITISE